MYCSLINFLRVNYTIFLVIYSYLHFHTKHMENNGIVYVVYEISKTIVFWTVAACFIYSSFQSHPARVIRERIAKYGRAVFTWFYSINDLKPLPANYLVDHCEREQTEKWFRDQEAYARISEKRREKTKPPIPAWFEELLRFVFGVEAPIAEPRRRDLRKFRMLFKKNPTTDEEPSVVTRGPGPGLHTSILRGLPFERRRTSGWDP